MTNLAMARALNAAHGYPLCTWRAMDVPRGAIIEDDAHDLEPHRGSEVRAVSYIDRNPRRTRIDFTGGLSVVVDGHRLVTGRGRP